MAVADQATTLAALAQRQLDRVVSPSTRRETWDRTLDVAARRPGAFVRQPSPFPPPLPPSLSLSLGHLFSNPNPPTDIFLLLNKKKDLPGPPNGPLPPAHLPLRRLRPLDPPPRPRRRGPLRPVLDRRRAAAARAVAVCRGRVRRLPVGVGRRVICRCEVGGWADGV